jgi:hypothetical protein
MVVRVASDTHLTRSESRLRWGSDMTQRMGKALSSELPILISSAAVQAARWTEGTTPNAMRAARESTPS